MGFGIKLGEKLVDNILFVMATTNIGKTAYTNLEDHTALGAATCSDFDPFILEQTSLSTYVFKQDWSGYINVMTASSRNGSGTIITRTTRVYVNDTAIITLAGEVIANSPSTFYEFKVGDVLNIKAKASATTGNTGNSVIFLTKTNLTETEE